MLDSITNCKLYANNIHHNSIVADLAAHLELSLLRVEDYLIFHQVDVWLHLHDALVIRVLEPDLLPLLEQVLSILAVLHGVAHLLFVVLVFLLLFLLQLQHPDRLFF